MMARGDINPWFPEKDVVTHQALGELTQIAARCLIQGIDESEPETDIPNRVALFTEMADVRACLIWLDTIVKPEPGLQTERIRRKLEGFQRWQAMLESV